MKLFTITFLFTVSILSGLLGMFTKEICFTLPIIIILFEYSFFKSSKKYLLLIIPFLLIIPAMFIYKYRTFKAIGFIFEGVPSQRFGDPLLTSTTYLLTQFRVIVTYIRLLFLPYGQNLDYDFPASQTILDLPTYGSYLLIIMILALGVWLFRKRRLMAIGIFWFFITLSVESSIIPIRNVMFEHRLYLPMFGFCLFVVSGIYYAIGGEDG